MTRDRAGDEKHVLREFLDQQLGRPYEPWPGAETDDVELDPSDTPAHLPPEHLPY